LTKYLFLSALHNRNEVLFYRLVSEHITEMLPYIYTPTVGDVSLHYSYLYTEPRGIYLSYPQRNKIEKIINNIPREHIDVIVVTDGERILGLGDLGTGGMAIPVGKLTLYTLFGGIHPGKTLPIMLDVGTNNPTLLNDPLYIGWREKRISGKEYDAFIDRFVKAVKKRFPKVLLQWEDFGRDHAQPLLEKYRHQICCFNDDIQGTASVALASLLTAIKMNHAELHQQKIVIFGGGSAGMGIANHLLGAMVGAGISKERALQELYIIDIHGLVHQGHQDLMGIPTHQKLFARPQTEISKWKVPNKSMITLLDVVKQVHPTVLIGVSAQPGVFNEEVITTMAHYVERPIIFPLSNPTSKSEAHPADLLQWTKGKAIIATGSPFGEVAYEGKKIQIAQCNNVYIYPGIGLGVIACKAKEVSETMFYKAAEILSQHSPMLKAPQGTLFPSFEQLREISREIALAVVKVAQEEGLSPKTDEKTRKKMVNAAIWEPVYKTFTE
ncbi:MAG TPA: NAD-dependent malic enzyme, partial [Rhabdochlamydiaceae bacterium]|nr:NAD-dependent malic enzyme [Rhabdochlamydiaceae bacterium]